MKRPIRVFQCKQDCCLVSVPSKRFWYVRTPSTLETHTSFRAAINDAACLAKGLPQEVTA
jgi:hypothetical protein